MVKLTFCLHRVANLSRQEFQRYWRETHAPLVLERARALRIRRYVQLHTVDHPVNGALRASRGAPEEYDGVAEIWWERIEDIREAAATPEGRAAAKELLEDERNFIDLARSPLWIGIEHPVVEP